MKIIRLTIYDNTHNRLKLAALPFGMNLTRWINQAMNEKLDKEAPGTIGVTPPVEEKQEPGKQTIDPDAIRADFRRKEAMKNPLAIGPLSIYFAGTTMYAVALANHKRKSKTGESLGVEGELELLAMQDPATMLTEDQKRAIMVEHGKSQAVAHEASDVDPESIPEGVRGHKILYRKWRAEKDAKMTGPALPEASESGELSDTSEYLELVKGVKTAKLAEDEEEDFWGDDELSKFRATVRKHNS